MNKPIASLIISTYKNTEFLKVVLDSVFNQTDMRFEIIISEDAEHDHVKSFIESIKSPVPLYHLTQPDLGWRKNLALNRAIEATNSDYLVFIDEDCVLHPRFMEFHIKYACEKAVLGGKRIKLDPFSTKKMVKGDLLPGNMNSYLLTNYFKIKKNGARFIEEGFFINPRGILGFVPRLRSMYQLKGCNMSFPKSAIYKINGFDEDYIRPAIGEDIDLTWRFQRAGYKINSVRNLAVQYHLYHKENWHDQEQNYQMMMEKQKRNEFVCRNGLVKL
ncbi:glycosyltransferase [Tenuifilum thalassicum]|uniref:Glycosyltransferase n=1 Tax=Tenuifilum thalassicum TaxID=2590900 RepID=A0A7D3XXS7_9BACT|nr:glycosyltransferase [Tenuifilum thalassicum]QKG81091.1 glycosyltransferase [Tenuifilum thalassicum]